MGRTEGVGEMSDIEKALDYIEKLRVENVKLAVLLNRYEQKTKHEWQGLTDEDRLRLKNYWKQPGVGVDELADAVEQAIKEKNT
jgi:formyltetrahydrofolate synthetase